MIYLLLGADDFSKRQYLQTLAAELRAEKVIYNDEQELPVVDDLIQQDLFGGKKIFILEGLLAQFLDPAKTDRLMSSKNNIVFIETKIDKRTSAGKDFLKNKDIQVQEFALPHGRELNDWLKRRAGELNLKIDQLGIEALAVRLGRDQAKEVKVGGRVISAEEVYNLWQADSELKKLFSFSAGKLVSVADVLALVEDNEEVDVLDLVNAIADKQKNLALDLLHKFVSSSGSDEKASVIQLNAILAEQFRNLLLVKAFSENKTSEDKILEATAWKSGRLFVLKKIAANFPKQKISELLAKLEKLDEELKTSTVPPKVLLDLILVQLF